MTKYLLGGVGLTGITSTCMFYEGIKEIPYSHEKGEISNLVEEGEEEAKTLIEKAGLECSGSYCKPSWSGKRKFNVEKDEKDENLVFGYGEKGKIRIHTGSEGYTEGLRFTIEGGDIPLHPRRNWFKNSILKLEEFENYEIKHKEGKYYFSRTKNSKEGKILELGLPEACVLPEEGQTTCSVFHVGKVRFGGEGFEGIVDGETSLTITKTEDKTFRDGYKFTFTFPQDVTIGGKVFRANSPTDFRMKKDQKGHLTLEWAWANEKDLLDKVGLICGENGNCTIKSGTLKIKKAENQDFLEISDISPGKIRLYKDDEYFNGLRLQVEGEKITSGNNTLEEFETYEIKEKGDEYYLLLKKTSEKRIVELLKYPCSLSTSECNITNERKLNVIKLEGKGESPLSLQRGQTINVAVSKTSEDDFPVGWKFTFTFPKDVTIGGKVVKANTPTDFKLKRHDKGNLTLERAWASENELAGKVGLSCDEDNNCTINGGTINIRKGEESQEIQLSTLDGGKIKLYKDTSGYSNGLKFTIEEKNIGTGDDTLEEFETYEIKEDSSKYYLALKTSADKKIKELLGYPGRCFDSSDCSGLNEEEIKKINFSGKDQDLMTLQSGKTVKITISKTSESDYLLGRKFIVESTADLTISNSTKVKANVPTEFKIKREGSEDLSLEKAWSEENILIGKVGLDCGGDGNCSLKNGSIRVKKEDKDFQISNLEGEGKIKLYKETAGYSNGLKFAVEEKKIVSGDNTLEEFETYEIAEDGYYLKLKTSAELEIKKLLKFPDRCYSKSTCENLSGDEFKNIKFLGKEDSLITISDNKKVKITVSQAPEDVFPLGRKITVESPANLKISSSTSLKANTPAEFKIEKSGSGQETNLTLEKLWNLKTLTEKVGLSCNGDICTITSGSLNVKRDGKLLTKASESNPQTPPGGKIKLIKDQEGYNEGFKFQIQDGNISLSDEKGQKVTLEEFESYEIKNNGSSHYLERKKTSLEGKWEALGLPEHCRSKFDNTKHGCPISENDLKKIKFSGKNANNAVKMGEGRVWLKISSDNSFPKKIRVKVEVRGEAVKIPKENDRTMILWKDYETEFRVKDEKNGNYSLEGTVNMNELVKKFGIENGNCDDENGCTIGKKINIYMSGTQYWRGAGVASEDQSKRITYRWGVNNNVNNFSQNIAFRVPDEGIKLSGGSDAHYYQGDISRIEKGTYEIKEYAMGKNHNESGDIPYLSKKNPGTWNPKDKFFNHD